jgi:sec-independent protein translocase protein TatA
MFNQIGPLEIGIVLLIVLLIFGPKRLPGLGKQLGTGMREFKDSITGKDSDHDDDDAEAQRPALTQAQAPAAPPVPPAAPPAGTPAEQNQTAASAFGQEPRT